jgi:hypothetical protein
MNATELITPPAAPGRAAPRSDAGHNASPSASKQPAIREMLAETFPLIGAIAGSGPPVIFLAGPWLLFALMLSGPFAFLLTLVVVMLMAATVLVALTAAILAIVAAPYLLIGRLRRYRARRAFSNDHAAQLVPVESTRVAA